MGGRGESSGKRLERKKAGVNPGKTVSKGALKREAHQALTLEVAPARSSRKSPKLGSSVVESLGTGDTGLTPILAGSSIAKGSPSDFSLRAIVCKSQLTLQG